MKIAAPILPARLEDATLRALQDGELEDALIRDVDATSCHVVALELSGVVMEKVTLTSAQLERISGRDVRMKRCDFSAAHLENGGLNRAEFSDCRMTGVDFNKTVLHDVAFFGCKVDMANFRFGDLRRVKFTDCTFVEADFLGATLRDVSFENCTLERTVFDQVKCKNVDLRGSELHEIAGWKSLKGAIIDSVQLAGVAPYLAQELGLRINNS